MRARNKIEEMAPNLFQSDFLESFPKVCSQRIKRIAEIIPRMVAKLLTLWTEAIKTETLEDETSKRLSANSEPSR
ncbi:uncharacterized protein BdWA1_003499 [Babesia duncani]|uniref:Uncharacterized protein n=1 Tax=Babesia duncani TaxID=323732 RepID=A0AAD9UMR6_9APIC|nr:hypothetical protein BdWA1_003499 [Babesia duncani]